MILTGEPREVYHTVVAVRSDEGGSKVEGEGTGGGGGGRAFRNPSRWVFVFRSRTAPGIHAQARRPLKGRL